MKIILISSYSGAEMRTTTPWTDAWSFRETFPPWRTGRCSNFQSRLRSIRALKSALSVRITFPRLKSSPLTPASLLLNFWKRKWKRLRLENCYAICVNRIANSLQLLEKTDCIFSIRPTRSGSTLTLPKLNKKINEPIEVNFYDFM